MGGGIGPNPDARCPAQRARAAAVRESARGRRRASAAMGDTAAGPERAAAGVRQVWLTSGPPSCRVGPLEDPDRGKAMRRFGLLFAVVVCVMALSSPAFGSSRQNPVPPGFTRER